MNAGEVVATTNAFSPTQLVPVVSLPGAVGAVLNERLGPS